jgi:glycosyltransferase involved in cell wall biosynthesis
MLPLVDELVINVGIGDDNTLELVQKFAVQEGRSEGPGECGRKVVILESDWQLENPEKKRGGVILSEQTNLALSSCRHEWCLYLQADEVIHEEDFSKIRNALTLASKNPEIDGLLFDYVHFYGSFDVVQKSRNVYRREVRVIRKSSTARSVGDAQSFRKLQGQKLNVLHSGARIFHYGWVRPPEAMKEKTFFFDQLYHGDPTPGNARHGIPHTGDNYLYKKIWGLRPFRGTHPRVMEQRIQSKGWHWDLQNSPLVFSWKDLKKVTLDLIENLTGHRFFEYRSYKLMK